MAEKSETRRILLRAVLAMGLAAGITMALFGLLGIAREWPAALGVAGAATVLLCVRARWPKAGPWLLGCAGAAGLLWLAAMGGLRTLQECAVGLWLHLMEIEPSLSLVSRPFACVTGLILMLACWVAVQESGVPLSLALTCAAAIALWAGGANRFLPWLTPSVAVTLYCMGQDGHEGRSRRRLMLTACVIAAAVCLLVPREGITVQPLREAADLIRQQIMDRFFFSESRNVFSLSREGYYPQGETQMGGPATPSEHAVMTVETPGTVYLRAVVKDEYTGRYWRDTISARRYLWDSRQWRETRAEVFDMQLPEGDEPSGTAAVRVTMDADGVSTLMVPQRIRSLSAGGGLVPYFNQSSEIFVTRDVETGDSYACEALILRAGDAGVEAAVRRAALAGDEARDEEIDRSYTRLPDHLQEQVFALTREAVGAAQTPYEKAMAIAAWLRQTGTYTLDAPAQDPAKDFVTSFLLEGRRGYCVHFASAMTVMCRAAGLPARYVEGYLAEPGADGVAHVTGMDGHAWTEVWLSGFGWLTFDATPPTEQPDGGDPPPETPPQPEPSPDPEPEPDPQRETETETEWNREGEGEQPNPESLPDPEKPRRPLWLWLLLVLLILLALALRIRYMMPEREAKRQRSETDCWAVWMQAVCDALRVEGRRRPANQSLTQWLTSIDGEEAYPVQLSPLGDCAGVIFYAHDEAIPEETEMTRRACETLLAGMRRGRRITFHLTRAFTRRRPFDGRARKKARA